MGTTHSKRTRLRTWALSQHVELHHDQLLDLRDALLEEVCQHKPQAALSRSALTQTLTTNKIRVTCPKTLSIVDDLYTLWDVFGTEQVPILPFITSLVPLACEEQETVRSFWQFALEVCDVNETGVIKEGELMRLLENLNSTISLLGDLSLSKTRIQFIVRDVVEATKAVKEQRTAKPNSMLHKDVVTMLSFQPWIKRLLTQETATGNKGSTLLVSSLSSSPSVSALHNPKKTVTWSSKLLEIQHIPARDHVSSNSSVSSQSSTSSNSTSSTCSSSSSMSSSSNVSSSTPTMTTATRSTKQRKKKKGIAFLEQHSRKFRQANPADEEEEDTITQNGLEEHLMKAATTGNIMSSTAAASFFWPVSSTLSASPSFSPSLSLPTLATTVINTSTQPQSESESQITRTTTILPTSSQPPPTSQALVQPREQQLLQKDKYCLTTEETVILGVGTVCVPALLVL